MELRITDRQGETIASSTGAESVILVYDRAYAEGDAIVLDCLEPGAFWVVQLEDSLSPALVYLAAREVRFTIPFGAGRDCYSPKAFTGARHLITVRAATGEEICARCNLVFNPFDQSGTAGMYPHASANIETRGESVFAARNTIDGIYANAGHGEYPYQSWGINRRPDAELTVEFGLPTEVDEARLTLRADFPHDSHWVRATLAFSDGSTEILELEKSALPQRFSFEKRIAEWVKLKDLVKAEDPSPFPALTQLEVWGRRSREKTD